MRRSREPGVWALFSAGGMLTALVMPALAFVLWIAVPLGWTPPTVSAELSSLVGYTAARGFLFVVITLALFHWAHRFRYTLYDGLQLYHLNHLIAIVTYGTATVGTLLAGFALVALP